MVGLRDQPTHALEEGGLEARRDVEIDPGFLRQGLGPRLVLVGQVRGCQRGVAHGSAGLDIGKEGLDVAGIGGAVEQRLLRALGEQAAVGPGGIAVEKGANLRCRAISATIDEPVDQLARGGIADPVAYRLGLGKPAAAPGRHGLAQAGGVSRREGVVAGSRDRCVVAGHVLGLFRHRLGDGHGLLDRCGSRHWSRRLGGLGRGFGLGRLGGGRRGLGARALDAERLAGGRQGEEDERGDSRRNRSHHVQSDDRVLSGYPALRMSAEH